LGLEYNFDYSFAPLGISSFARNLASTSAASAQAALSPLLATTGGVVNSMAFTNKEAGHQMFNTVAANIYLRPMTAKWRPYLTVGGGILNNLGNDASIDLLSMIQAGNGASAVNERDLLSVRFQPQNTAGVFLYGAGIKRYFGDHWGLRADVRD